MRVLVLCYEYPPLGGGGGRAARDVSRQLARDGCEIRAYTAHHKGLPWRENDCGADVRRCVSGRIRRDRCSVPEMAGYIVGAFLPALRACRQWKPDVIHAHFAVPTGALAFALHRCTGIPYVLTAQLGDVPGAMPGRTDALFRRVYPFTVPIWKRAAVRTACSRFTAECAEKAYGLPVEVIENGMDLEGWSAFEPVAHNPVRLVFAGRFDPQKNLTLLFEGLKHCQHRNWTLTLIGDGPQRAALEALAASPGFEERVRFTGWIAPEDVRPILEGSDVFVMPSLNEGLPLTALEALRAGLAVIGSDIGGLRDVLVDGRNGRVFAGGDAAALARAIDTVIADPQRLLAYRCSSLELAPTFDLRRIADRYLDVLRLAVSARHA